MTDNGTSAVRYVPGSAVLLRRDGRAVMLRLLADHGLVSGVWDRLLQNASIDQLLELVLEEGLKTVSEFALLERVPGGVRIILRGGINAEVRRDDQVETIETEGIWVDRRVEGDGVLVLGVDGAGEGAQLPVEAGIVLADRALIPLTDQSADQVEQPIAAPAEATDAEAEPLAEQEEQPADQSVHADGGFGAGIAAAPLAEPESAAEPMHDAPAVDAGPESAPEPEPASEPQFGAAPPPPAFGAVPPPPAFGAVPPPPSGGAQGEGQPQAHQLSADDGWQDSDEPVDVAVQDNLDATQMTTAVGDEAIASQPAPPYHGPVMLLPDGQEIELSSPVIVGRAPKMPEGRFGAEPRLVSVQDPNRDVSSTHLEVAFDGQRLMVTDLGSTNGTDLVLPGQPVQLLQAHQPTELLPGGHLMLAGSQKVDFEAR